MQIIPYLLNVRHAKNSINDFQCEPYFRIEFSRLDKKPINDNIRKVSIRIEIIFFKF